MKKIIISLILIIAVSSLTYLILPPKIPLSPLGNNTTNNSTANNSKSNYLIIGFAPYWNLKKLTSASLSTITHLAFFALHLNGDGTLYTKVNSREEEPGYTNYKRLLANPVCNPQESSHCPKLIMTYMQKDQEALSLLLSSTSNRSRAIKTIISTLEDAHADGVNIDFEPTSDSSLMQTNFTYFIQELKQRTCPQTSSHCPLITISIYPSAASKPRLWDLPQLADQTDYFVVMTYDYTMPKSTIAGPNSPLRDISGSFEHNVIKNLGEIYSQINPTKIILGIPLYGYEWDTTTSDKYAPTKSYGATASLERIESMLRDQTLELIWDRNSLTPYGVSTSSGITTQIYFENQASINLKLDLVKSSSLGGIALWALGYDNNVDWLWPTIGSLN